MVVIYQHNVCKKWPSEKTPGFFYFTHENIKKQKADTEQTIEQT